MFLSKVIFNYNDLDVLRHGNRFLKDIVNILLAENQSGGKLMRRPVETGLVREIGSGHNAVLL